jgi:hypothetical protein
LNIGKQGPPGDDGSEGNRQVEQIDEERFSDMVEAQMYSTPEELSADGYQILLRNRLAGVYEIAEKNDERVLDGLVTSQAQARVFTTARGSENSQLWLFTPVEAEGYLIQQLATERYLDADGDSLAASPGDLSRYTMTAGSSAHLEEAVTESPTTIADAGGVAVGSLSEELERLGESAMSEGTPLPIPKFDLFTTGVREENGQVWEVTPVGPNRFRIRQRASGRYVSARDGDQDRLAPHLRRFADDENQEWTINKFVFRDNDDPGGEEDSE